VKKVELKNIRFYISRYEPLELELCNLKLEGCTVVINDFPLARDLGFREVEYSLDNIQTLRGVPLFHGRKCAFYAVLYLISRGAKPVKAVRLMKNFLDFDITQEEARIIILLNNVKGITKKYELGNGDDSAGD